MNYYSESDFEDIVIEKVKEHKLFKYYSFEEVIKLRNHNEGEVILDDIFASFIQENNKGISKGDLTKMTTKIRGLKDSSIEIANENFYKFLSEGIKIWNDEEERTKTYKVMNFDDVSKNSFIVTNQFRMTSSHPDQKIAIPDVVIYVNGLPVIVIELKSPKSEQDLLSKAWQQIENYKKYISDLFVFNAFNIISDFATTKYGSLTASESRYQFWRGEDFDNSDSFSGLFEKLLNPETLLDVIKNFTFFAKKGTASVKIVAGYHQYYGVKNAIASIDESIKGNTKNKGKGGVFWHTQGSGKSFSMMFLARNLSREDLHPGTTFLVITDRNDLDDQLFQTFLNAQKYLNQQVKQISSINDLRETLDGIKQDGVYFSTVQKFKEGIGTLSDRNDIVIITDEAHRSHNNVDGKMIINDAEMTQEKHFGSAAYLRKAFPNATFIGFTGTPVENDDISTRKIYGNDVSRYLMSHAEQDGVIVPIRFEIRKPKLHFNEEALEELDKKAEEIIRSKAEESEIPIELRKKVNKIVKQLSNFIKDTDRINGIVDDFIEHYNKRKNILKGKAMFVTFDREAAFKIYKRILKKMPEWDKVVDGVQTGPLRILFTPNKQNDKSEYLELAGSSKYRKKLGAEFKKDDSDFKVVIVVDMWLTGFDVPALDTLYLDKPIKMHNLMQTIARTNRVYNNKKESIVKENGLIVDYIGATKKLEEALAFYSGFGDHESEKTSADIEQLKKMYLERVETIYDKFFDDVDFKEMSKSKIYRFNLLRKCMDTLSAKNQSQDFVTQTKLVSKWIKEVITICSDVEIVKMNFLAIMRTQIIKINLNKINFKNIEKELKSQLDKAIEYSNTELVGQDLDSFDVNTILKFIADENSEYAHLDKDMKFAAVKKLILEIKKVNIIKSRKMSDSLKQLMDKYESNYITLKELMQGIKDIAREITEYVKQEKDATGYTKEELAFYQILLDGESASDLDKEIIAKILKEVLDIVNNKHLVNGAWTYNQAMVKKVRAELFTVLVNNGYPPISTNLTRDSIIEQIMYQLDIKKESIGG